MFARPALQERVRSHIAAARRAFSRFGFAPTAVQWQPQAALAAVGASVKF